MARLIATLFALSLPLAALEQTAQDERFKQAGVCARCHVISVVEWSASVHPKAGTDCVACHGASQGHVIDERNNIKPERMPHGAAIAALCADCHKAGCPKTRQTASCQNCHHVHALMNPAKPPVARDEKLERLAAQREQFTRRMQAGETLLASQQWEKARAEFRAALDLVPGDPRAAARLRLSERRIGLKRGLAGFDIAGAAIDAETGLPREVRVMGVGFSMALIPGGKFEMGSERYPGSVPVHTVIVRPFYLGTHEVTRAEWQAVMGALPGPARPASESADRLPVEGISWDDAQAFVKKLNATVAGAGFRLPAEAEWEFAARSGAQPVDTAYVDQQAPRAAGSGRPDKLGLYDMLGNVWEWCSSLYKPYPYAPSDGRESAGDGMRVLRGGSYIESASMLDPAFRHAERPARRLPGNGLRIARDVPEP